MPNNKKDASLIELCVDLLHDVIKLIRQEAEFARLEIAQRVSETLACFALMIVGGVVAYTGLLALIAAGVVGVTRLGILPFWLVLLFWGILILAIGLVLVWLGRRRWRNKGLLPQRTLEIMEGEREWIKDRLT
jgi:hypothetical protein